MRTELTVVVLFAVVGIMAVCTQQVQAELWAQWLLNVDSGSAIREEVQGTDSLLEGPTAPIAGTYVSSPRGTALQFNNSQYIRLQFPGSPGDDLPEGFMNDMSVAYWLKFDGFATNIYSSLLTNSHNEFGNRLVNHLQSHSDFTGNHNLPPYATRHFANLCGTGPGDGGCHGDNNIVEADTWYHLVYTSNWDGNAGQRTDNFYVDGVLAETATSDGILNGHASLKFGQARGNPYISGHQQFYGQLDQLEIYDTALTVNEVVALFNDGSPPINLTWAADTSGNWSSAASWTPPGSPNAATHTAVFGNSTTGPTTAVLTSDVTVNRIEFNSTQPYAIAGLYSVNLETDPDDPSDAFGFPTLSATAGSHQVQANVNLQANTTADIAAGATLEFVNRLNLGGNTLTQTGDGTLLVNNSFNTGSGTIVNSGGVLGGGGSIGGDVQNSGGTVAPGNSPGALTIDGHYNQTSGGTLAIEIGGTQAGVEYDVLQVLGDVSLAGTLSVSLIDGFTPSGGNTFKVLTASGELTDLGLTLGGSDAGSFTMSIDTTNDWIMLMTAGAGLAGDYNGNGTVDAADYTIFRDNLGGDSAVLNGNGSGAATVVQADYDLWKQNFGSSGTGSSGAVPEPSSVVLMVLIGHAAIALRKRSMA